MGNAAPQIRLAREHSQADLRAARRAGEIERVRRGAYRELAPTPGPAVHAAHDERLRALARIHAVDRQLRSPHVFSHVSAALLWGLALWTTPAVTHLYQPYRAGASAAADLARHRGTLEQHVLIGGIPATDLTRTVVDCLTTLHPLDGLVLADSALRHALDRNTARLQVEARTRRNGRARALLLLDLADAGAESPWESWARYTALRLGLPRPVTQHPVVTRLGTFRVDVAWPEHGVLLEFDGLVKYQDGVLTSGYSGTRALVDEKRREDAIVEATGARLLRLTSRDATRPKELARRLEAAFAPTQGLRPDPRLPLPR